MNDHPFYITTALMGYGHLRAADNVAGLGRGRLVRVDLPPFAALRDVWVWNGSQHLYHGVSRTVETRLRFLFRMMERIEDIPEDSRRASLEYSRLMRFLVRMGVGRGLRRLGDAPRLHMFFLPNLACVYNRFPGKNYQLLCDADLHRVWAPIRPNEGEVTYLAPTAAGADRMRSYGVAHERIFVTGFPLPLANTGGRDLGVLRSDLRARLARLAPGSDSPLRLVFAVSGAGCYLNVLAALIRALLPRLRDGRVTLAVAAGDNLKAKRTVERCAERQPGIEVLYSADLHRAFGLFNQALRESDLLITKPGELVFYAALGIPQILLPPIGKHEAKNRAYLLENSAALDFPGFARATPARGATRSGSAVAKPDVVVFAEWAAQRRADGTWQRAAESAFSRLPKHGAFEINDIVCQ